jgi:hypothetical protein
MVFLAVIGLIATAQPPQAPYRPIDPEERRSPHFPKALPRCAR